MDVVTAIMGVVGVAVGVLSSHATLGKDVRQVLTEIKDVRRRVDRLEEAVPVHFHRRATDAIDA